MIYSYELFQDKDTSKRNRRVLGVYKSKKLALDTAINFLKNNNEIELVNTKLRLSRKDFESGKTDVVKVQSHKCKIQIRKYDECQKLVSSETFMV